MPKHCKSHSKDCLLCLSILAHILFYIPTAVLQLLKGVGSDKCIYFVAVWFHEITGKVYWINCLYFTDKILYLFIYSYYHFMK